ncbi:uncharacterized protein EV420DRAFT_986581 [Desarmillaria tabescens]|uniref:Uncharacterized protein n=1 Tax=Armillaria tabescens TaxID=1929756 RepID=A0AA39JQV0_ARMTA|nr:uncharacterized protein EV420DRAFT_986581 [Desarmillaria tabescens]KAK0444898.1 hypothetical protein EV420DRAFT_986581 [Desarmillaria tabescens]
MHALLLVFKRLSCTQAGELLSYIGYSGSLRRVVPRVEMLKRHRFGTRRILLPVFGLKSVGNGYRLTSAILPGSQSECTLVTPSLS